MCEIKAKSSRRIWSIEETKVLLLLMKENKVMEQLDGKPLNNNKVYVFLANELDKKGIKKNSDQVKLKLHSLKRGYFKPRHSDKNDGKRKIMDYIEDLNDLLCDRPVAAAVKQRQFKIEVESNRCRWSREETKYLLSLMKENKVMGQLQIKTRRNNHVYALLANELAKKGYEKNSKQVKYKLRTLKTALFRPKRIFKKSKSGQKSVEILEDLKELISDSPATSTVGHKELKIQANSRCCWSTEETKNLLALMKEHQVMDQLNGKTCRNNNVYVFLANELRKKGFIKNSDQVKLKFRYLKNEFFKPSHSDQKNGNQNIMDYIEDLNDLLCDRTVAAAVKQQQFKIAVESNRCRWSREETKFLLSLMKQNKVMGHLQIKSRRNNHVYELLANELAKKGYKKNSKQVKYKLRSLKTALSRPKRIFKKSKSGQKSVEILEDLKELISDIPATSTVRHKELKIQVNSRCCWSTEETKNLLALMKEHQVMDQLNGKTCRNNNVYVFLANELGKKGFTKNSDHVKLKFRYLKSEFFKTNCSNGKSGAKRRNMKHFEDLNELLGDRSKTATVELKHLRTKESSSCSQKMLKTCVDVKEQPITKIIKEENDFFVAEECRLHAEYVQTIKKIKTEDYKETKEML